MSFHNARFPSSISFKAEGGPVFKTEISTVKSGQEKRNILWSKSRAEYQINFKEISQNEVSKLISFFMARMGKAYSFRFKDWNDFEANDEIIGDGDGTKTDFQLTKKYGDDENIYTRKITKPVEGSMRVYISGVEQQSGYSLNYNDGIIIFDNPISLGSEVSASFQFDIHVRFENDMLLAKTDSYSTSSIKNIKLIEIK